MNRFTCSFFIFVCCFVPRQLSAQPLTWEEVAWYSSAEDLHDIAMNRSKQTVIVGDNGALFFSTDSLGITFIPDRITNGVDLRSVCFLDSITLLTAGDSGRIYRSTNFGKDWMTTILPSMPTIYSLARFDDQTAVLVGERGLIVRTSDKGVTWETINSTIEDTLFKVLSIGPNTGIIVGSRGTILKTTDTGMTWEAKQSSVQGSIKQIIHPSGQTLYVSGEKWTMLRSHDNGSTWQRMTIDSAFTSAPNMNIHCIGYFTMDSLYALVREDSIHAFSIYFSYDGGTSWTQKKESHKFAVASHNISQRASLLVGEDGKIERTGNGGKSWQTLAFTPLIDRILFRDSLGLLFGTSISNFIYRTTDRGTSWKLVFNEKLMPAFLDVTIVDGGVVALLDDIFSPIDSNILLRSDDHGQTWKKVDHGIGAPINAIAIRDHAVGMLYRKSPDQFMLTFDGGLQWEAIENPLISSPCYAEQMLFVGNTIVSLLYNNGKRQVHVSTDIGKAWSASDVSIHTDRLYFHDSLIGWAVGSERTGVGDRAKDIMYKTTNGGKTWEEVINREVEPAFGITDIAFGDESIGVATRHAGQNVHYTSDGGETWNIDNTIANFTLPGDPSNIEFATTRSCFIKSGGVLLRCTLDLPASIANSNTERSGSWLFPNPVYKNTPVTIIQSEAFRDKEIIIFDALGRLIRRDMIPAQTDRFMLDTTKLVPGIYYVRAGEKKTSFIKH